MGGFGGVSLALQVVPALGGVAAEAGSVQAEAALGELLG